MLRRIAIGHLIGAGAAALAFAALLVLWLSLADLFSDGTWRTTVTRETSSGPWDEISDAARLVLGYLGPVSSALRGHAYRRLAIEDASRDRLRACFLAGRSRSCALAERDIPWL
jgi:hypothetical protein